MSRLRTFLAVPLAEETRWRLVELQRCFGLSGSEVKWVEPENLHVTLVFLGDVSAEEIPGVCRAAQDAVAELPPFMLTIQDVGCFPHTRRPRILWAGVATGAEALTRLYEQLTLYLEVLGFRRDERAYAPH